MAQLRALGDRLRRRLKKLLELYLIPGFCALLPWPWPLRLLKPVAAMPWWFREEVDPATRHAHALGFAPDPVAFARRMRLRIFIDNMDGYLTLLRGRRYIDRWCRLSGDPLPSEGPLLYVGLHHGCGFWFLPLMRRHGVGPRMVVPNVRQLTADRGLIEGSYLRMRINMMAWASGEPVMQRGAAREGLLELLSKGGICCGVPDIPTGRADAVEVEIAGMRSRLAQGMFELARDTGAQAYLYTTDTDLETGHRLVHVQKCRAQTPESATREFAAMLTSALRRDPTGWRLWSIAPDFFPEQFRHDQDASA